MAESRLDLQQIVSQERKKVNGLLILEAFYGLSSHIQDIELGVLRFESPKTVEEYLKCQVVLVKKQL
jgi:hypothetical protein